MKVLLLFPPWDEVYGRFSVFTHGLNRCPPINLCYLASSLKAAGHEAKVIDLEPLPRKRAVLKDILESERPQLVGITSTTPIFHVARRIAEIVCEYSDAPVVLGGAHITIEAERALSDAGGATFALLGEAERSLVALADALEGRGALSDVAGLLVREGERIVRYGELQLIDDLDSLPEPYFGDLDFRNYLWSVRGRGIVRGGATVTSRGCPYNCVFCSNAAISKRKVRFRDPAKVVNEVIRLHKEHGVRHLVFHDDTLTLSRERIMAIADGLRRANLDLTWEGDTRADKLDPELLRAMADAGCVRISIGIESADPKILESIGKGVTLEHIRNALRWAKQVGMETRANAIIGLPYETRETIRRTIEFLRDLKDLDHPYLNIAMPYAGTRLREMALAGEGGLKILDDRWEAMKRWGNAIMQVGDITPEEMMKIHNRAVISMYAKPRRLWYNLTRAGLLEGLRMALAFLWRVIFKRGGQPVEPYSS